MLGMYLNGILGTGIASIFLNLHKRMWCMGRIEVGAILLNIGEILTGAI
jgi:hypothetical protein